MYKALLWGKSPCEWKADGYCCDIDIGQTSCTGQQDWSWGCRAGWSQEYQQVTVCTGQRHCCSRWWECELLVHRLLLVAWENMCMNAWSAYLQRKLGPKFFLPNFISATKWLHFWESHFGRWNWGLLGSGWYLLVHFCFQTWGRKWF